MKKIITLLMIAGAVTSTLFVHAQQLKIHNIAVKPQQIDQLAAMVKVLKYQSKRHCDLCAVGKNPRFMNMTPQEFEYRFNKSAQEMETTINDIVKFYSSIGVDKAIIDEEARNMRATIYDFKK